MCVATLSHDLSYDVCVCRRDTCTWTLHVHPLCQSYYGCSNGAVTKHGSTGHGCQKPEIVVNGLKKAGIFDVLSSDGQ